MALTIGDNFSYQGAKPLDARLTYNTLSLMKAVADATMYDGCTAYCKEADKTYQWKSTNTVDETLGRWREFSSGGGAGGGHTIEDSEGTDLTQRDILQFGEGFKAEDDDTNEKTVISPNVMQSGDMDDVVTPLPSIAPKKEGIKYSTTEQVVGEWLDGKPLYQRTFYISALPNNSEQQFPIDLSNVDNIADIRGICKRNNDAVVRPLPYIYGLGHSGSTSTTYLEIGIWLQLVDGSWKVIVNTGSNRSDHSAYVTIQYTKTTDTATT